MNIRELLQLSFRALRANKMRSILTMLGVIIGVFAVILLVSIGSGLQNYIESVISWGPTVNYTLNNKVFTAGLYQNFTFELSHELLFSNS